MPGDAALIWAGCARRAGGEPGAAALTPQRPGMRAGARGGRGSRGRLGVFPLQTLPPPPPPPPNPRCSGQRPLGRAPRDLISRCDRRGRLPPPRCAWSSWSPAAPLCAEMGASPRAVMGILNAAGEPSHPPPPCALTHVPAFTLSASPAARLHTALSPSYLSHAAPHVVTSDRPAGCTRAKCLPFLVSTWVQNLELEGPHRAPASWEDGLRGSVRPSRVDDAHHCTRRTSHLPFPRLGADPTLCSGTLA